MHQSIPDLKTADAGMATIIGEALAPAILADVPEAVFADVVDAMTSGRSAYAAHLLERHGVSVLDFAKALSAA